jgi:hypothetical protein
MHVDVRLEVADKWLWLMVEVLLLLKRVRGEIYLLWLYEIWEEETKTFLWNQMVTFSCETELSAHLNLFEYLKNSIQFQNDFFNEIW